MAVERQFESAASARDVDDPVVPEAAGRAEAGARQAPGRLEAGPREAESRARRHEPSARRAPGRAARVQPGYVRIVFGYPIAAYTD